MSVTLYSNSNARFLESCFSNDRCSGCQLSIAAAFIRAIPLFCTYTIGKGSRELVEGRAAVAVGARRNASMLQVGATDTLLSEHSPAALRARITTMLSAGLRVCASTVCGTAVRVAPVREAMV